MLQNRTKIIAEIGINHNGSLDICKRLIDISSEAGCNYVKIQKRNPDVCVPEHQKFIVRPTPWGDITYLDYKKKLEFDEPQIKELQEYSLNKNIEFFASVWDIDSIDIMKKYSNIVKVPSALITDINLCKYARKCFSKLIISTGMSTEKEIETCIEQCDPDIIMHSNSTYPCPVQDLNLNYITWLKYKWTDKEIGYSGHEKDLSTTYAAKMLGAKWIERHITLNNSMWGSDQSCSLEPDQFVELTRGIRQIEESTKEIPGPRTPTDSELIKKNSLRKGK